LGQTLHADPTDDEEAAPAFATSPDRRSDQPRCPTTTSCSAPRTAGGCPFGAHIRRVNPRESFEPGSKEQLAIANRHRIFRVGRAYPPQSGSPNPGLLFMCVNASIERQFEFVQQTYMLGASFQGLEHEVDAFARRPGSSDVLTIPTENGPLRLRGLGDFVTVRGGGYFFMPGRGAVRLLIGGV
jgi:deferrochelatase/peroxidase EfeB